MYWLQVLASLPFRNIASILVSSLIETIMAFPRRRKARPSISAEIVRLVSAAPAPVDRRRDFLRVGCGKGDAIFECSFSRRTVRYRGSR